MQQTSYKIVIKKQEQKALHSEFYFTQGKLNLIDPLKSKKFR